MRGRRLTIRLVLRNGLGLWRGGWLVLGGRNLPQDYEYTRKVVEQFLRTID